MFFEKEENLDKLKEFIEIESSFTNPFSSHDVSEISSLIINTVGIFKSIIENPKIWDENCTYSIEQYGNGGALFNLISKVIDNKDLFSQSSDSFNQLIESSRNIYLLSLRFLFEMDFMLNENSKEYVHFNNKEIANVKKNAVLTTQDSKFDYEFRTNLLYVIHSTPILVSKAFLHSDKVDLFSNIDEKALKVNDMLKLILSTEHTVDNKISDFEQELEARQIKVDKLEETLKKQQSRLNFAGLSEGFHNLLIQKSSEAKSLYKWLVSMGIIMIIPLICIIFGWLPDSILKENTSLNYVIKIVPFISLEIILIYFFRVILQNYKSVKAQVLQIELRRTLCQFIESYTDYSNDVKGDKETNPLDKFENLIFSGIISDSENLPSTFDGMDQITKLLTSLKGK